MPMARAAAPAKPSPPDTRAKASPTAIPSGTLCRVMAVISRVVCRQEASCQVRSRRRWGSRASRADRKTTPNSIPPAAGSQRPLCGPVDGRQQQAPHGGRRHDSSSKAQQGLLKVGPGFPGEKKHHGRAQSGHQKCEARTQGRPAKRLQHSTNAFSLIQAEHRPYASISGRTSRRDRACIRGRCVIWYRQQEKLI